MKLVFGAMHKLRFDGPNPLTAASRQYTVMPSQGVVVEDTISNEQSANAS